MCMLYVRNKTYSNNEYFKLKKVHTFKIKQEKQEMKVTKTHADVITEKETISP